MTLKMELLGYRCWEESKQQFELQLKRNYRQKFHFFRQKHQKLFYLRFFRQILSGGEWHITRLKMLRRVKATIWVELLLLLKTIFCKIYSSAITLQCLYTPMKHAYTVKLAILIIVIIDFQVEILLIWTHYLKTFYFRS